MHAKQNGMNDDSLITTENIKRQNTRITLLLRRLQGALTGRSGKPATYRDIEEWTRVPETTVKDWFNNRGRPTAEMLVSLLERVPREIRHQAVDSACRTWPALDDSRLNCDDTDSSRLRTMACQPNGLILIQGGTDEARTFLLTALANEFLTLTAHSGQVTGIDVHEPDWFVPVPHVTYLHNEFDLHRQQEAVERLWPRWEGLKNRLIVFNGVWAAMRNLRKAISPLAAHNLVILADQEALECSQWRKNTKLPYSLITVLQPAERKGGIGVQIETF